MLRPRPLLLFAALTLALVTPVAASPLPPAVQSQPRLVVFESFMNPG